MIFFEDTPFPGYKRDPFLEVPYIYVFFFQRFFFFFRLLVKTFGGMVLWPFFFFFFAEILSIISLIWSPPQPVVPKPIWTHLALWGLQPILFKTYPDPNWPNLALWGLQPILFKTYPSPNWPNLALTAWEKAAKNLWSTQSPVLQGVFFPNNPTHHVNFFFTFWAFFRTFLFFFFPKFCQ